jgi:glycosyltransferase involved in cell wall biosynthesis
MISVLMSTYKEPISYVQKAVQSILNQSYSNIEFIIIVDDPQNEPVIKYLKTCEEKDERIRIYINDSNIGLVASLNKGLLLCKGEYIARMDADDISNPTRLENQLCYIKKKGYDLVGAQIETFTDERTIGTFCFPEEYSECKKALRYYTSIPHPAWLCKREIYEKLEGYRDIKACEDYDFLIRAVLAGFKFGNCPEKLLRYRRNMLSISNTNINAQKVIAKFLSQKFRHGKAVEMEEYKEYIQSEKYERAVLKNKKLDQNKKEYKQTNNLFKKVYLLIKILLDFDFIRQKISIKKTSRSKGN